MSAAPKPICWQQSYRPLRAERGPRVHIRSSSRRPFRKKYPQIWQAQVSNTYLYVLTGNLVSCLLVNTLYPQSRTRSALARIDSCEVAIWLCCMLASMPWSCLQ